MTRNDLDQMMQVIETVAKEAGELLLKLRWSGPIKVTSWKEFVTSADLQADNLITERLRAQYPHIPILSEESGGERHGQGWQFVVDPIDGTNNYAKRFGPWSVSIAAVNNGRTEVAVVRDPERNCTFYAIREQEGTWCQHENGTTERLQIVNAAADLQQAHIWTDWVKGDNQRTIDILKKLKEHSTYPRIAMCATQSLIMVAEGRLDGYVHPSPAPEDIAAAALLVEQAGGSITTLDGESWSPFSLSIVATSNPVLHNAVLELLK